MKKITLVFFLSCLFLLVGCSNEQSEKEYEQNLKQVEQDIITQSASVENVVNSYSNVWRNNIEMTLDKARFARSMGISIDEVTKYITPNAQGNIAFKGNFNEALQKANGYFVETGKNAELDKARQEISKRMKELNSPPEQYQEAYDIVFELYSLYETYLTLALSPSGSLRDYNSEANRLTSEIITKTKEFEVKLPNE